MNRLYRFVGTFLQVTAVLGGALLLSRAGMWGFMTGGRFIGPLLMCALWGTLFWKAGSYLKTKGTP